MRDIRGQTALITGAGRGIGRASAVALAREGCSLALLARSARELEETALLCGKECARALVFPTDVTDPQALERVVNRTVSELGGLDILVNNAGIYISGQALDSDPDEWERMMAVNLTSAMRLTRLSLPHIVRGGRGAVIFISSLAGKFTYPMNSAYCASKHGMVAFSGSLFQEVRERKIKVCAICPGYVATRMSEDRGLDQARMLQPEDVAAAVRFVATFPDTGCPTEILLNPQLPPD